MGIRIFVNLTDTREELEQHLTVCASCLLVCVYRETLVCLVRLV